MDHKVMIKAPNLNCLYIQDVTLGRYMLHEVHSLSEVSLKLCCMGDIQIHAHHVLDFLKGSTKAKFLYLSEGAMLDICFEKPSGFTRAVWSKALKEFVWDKTVVRNELERMPHCLLLHTKKIDIRECYGLDYELELIKYLLKNCEVLESMTIHNMKWTSKEKEL